MSDDFWNSQDASFYMAQVGKDAGVREGYKHGFDEGAKQGHHQGRVQGYQEGRQQGYQEGLVAMEAEMRGKIAQLQSEISGLQELLNGAVAVMSASNGVILAASDEEKSHVAFIYDELVSKWIQKKSLRIAPHVDGRFIKYMPNTAQMIREAIAARGRLQNTPEI